MKKTLPLQAWDFDSEHSDFVVDQYMREHDETIMPLPSFESEPHLLMSKVRKHYMEYIIKLLSINYENNHRLLNKNIYLPSAIWRCAKNIEMNAAQSCMVMQIYRNKIVAVVKELKNDTKRGKLHKILSEYLRKPPENHKIVQTTLSNECNCMCKCSQRKKRRISASPKPYNTDYPILDHVLEYNAVTQDKCDYKIPVVENTYSEFSHISVNDKKPGAVEKFKISNANLESNISPKPCTQVSETHDDDLMLQLEKLFQGESNEDDLFDHAMCDFIDSTTYEDSTKKCQSESNESANQNFTAQKQDLIIENHAAQIKSLDERLVSLSEMLVNNDKNVVTPKQDTQKNRKSLSSKWLCEEYYLKSHLFELLDQIGDCNRKKLARVMKQIKDLLRNLFGDDSDDEGMMSPLEETPEFVLSCKERIAPWVVKLLTPYYIKGRIKGKALFKALAKHLIRLIYQCSHYPSEYEVQSFVGDFLKNHKMIRCEADFKEFRIENV